MMEKSEGQKVHLVWPTAPPNVDPIWRLLADQQPVPGELVAEVLGAYKQRLGVATWLADCQAATAESLPASASRRERERMVSLCQMSIDGLSGSPVVQRGDSADRVVERCTRAAQALLEKIRTPKTQKVQQAHAAVSGKST